MLNSKVHIYLLMVVCARMEEEGEELRYEQSTEASLSNVPLGTRST